MDDGLAAQSARGMTGPSQGAGKSRGQSRGRDLEPRRFTVARRQQWRQGRGQRAGQDETDEPGASESRLRQHGPQHAVAENLRRRLVAHRRRGQNQPRRARDRRQREADPGDDGKPRPNLDSDSAVAGGAAPRRRGNEDRKQNNARHQHRRGEVNGSCVEERIGQRIEPSLVPADVEREGAFGRVGVDRERVPVHLVAAGADGFQSDRHGVAADLRLALVDPGAARRR